MIDEPGETYVYLKMNCRLKPDEIQEMVNGCADKKYSNKRCS